MKKLLMLSGKGGTGKTTISAAFIKLSQAKAVADCDVDAPNLHLVTKQNAKEQIFDFFGGEKAYIDPQKCTACGICQDKCRFDAINIINQKAVVNEFMCEGCAVCQFVCPSNAVTLLQDTAGTRKLYVDDTVFSTAILKMGRGNSGKLVSEVKQAMFKSAPQCEIAIVDGSPGIGCPVIASVNAMDMVLIVVEPSKSGLSDLERLVATVDAFDVKMYVCVNKYDTNIELTNQIEELCKQEDIDFVGKIPYDSKAIQAVNAGYSIVDIDCKAGQAVKKIYNKVVNQN